jgi:hypothetical protein
MKPTDLERLRSLVQQQQKRIKELEKALDEKFISTIKRQMDNWYGWMEGADLKEFKRAEKLYCAYADIYCDLVSEAKDET